MRCQRAQQMLMAYHDGELSRGAARRVEKHLESCTECGPLLERLRLADHHAGSAVDPQGMSGLPGMVPPDDRYWDSFTARVLDRVEEDAATRAPESHKPRRNWNFIIPRMAPAFSIALVVVVAAGVLIKIGDPIPVPKAPVTRMDPVPETGVTALERRALQDREDSFADSPGEEPSAPLVEKTRENDGAFKSTAPSVAEPKPQFEKIAELKILEEKAATLKKGEVFATPDVGAETPEAITGAAPAPVVQEALSQRTRDQEPALSVSAAVEGAAAGIEEVEKAAPQVPMESKLDQTGISKVETGMPQAEKEPSTAPVVRESDLNVSAGRDDQAKEKAAIVGTQLPSSPAATGMPENILAADVAPNAGLEQAAFMEDGDIQAREEPVKQTNEVADSAAVEQSGGGKPAVSAADAIESPAPLREAGQAFGSRLPYRGPEDQLIHAKNLAEVRKFWESEQVLKDLLSQRTPPPIQAEASILLVKVLSSQNRLEEAQQVLDDARVMFPTSETVQTFDLKQEGRGQ